jgi:hypothetical protein
MAAKKPPPCGGSGSMNLMGDSLDPYCFFFGVSQQAAAAPFLAGVAQQEAQSSFFMEAQETRLMLATATDRARMVRIIGDVLGKVEAERQSTTLIASTACHWMQEKGVLA